jgi:serine/threonine protein kinase
MASEDYGQWKILQSLSEGGQAHTYLCKNELDFDSDTIYVLKRLKNKKRIERFLNEINAVRSLAHPNILKIIDFDVNASKPYLVTPYYSRGTLTSIGLENLSVDKALAIFEKICSGVAAAHEKDVIHRDIKPDNIFLSETGEPIVGDFGICHLDNGERFTLTDEAVGAFRFMAPELEDGRYDNIDCRCDVYSLGKLLYWLLTGKSFSREQHREKKYDLIGDDGNRVARPRGKTVRCR